MPVQASTHKGKHHLWGEEEIQRIIHGTSFPTTVTIWLQRNDESLLYRVRASTNPSGTVSEPHIRSTEIRVRSGRTFTIRFTKDYPIGVCDKPES